MDFSQEAPTEQPPIPIPIPPRPLKITPQVRFNFPIISIPTATPPQTNPPVPGPTITTTAPSSYASHAAAPLAAAFATTFARVDAQDASTTPTANSSTQPGPDVSTSGAPPAQPRDYTVQNFFQMKNAVPAAPQTQEENPFAAYFESLKTGASAKQNPFATPQATNGSSNPSNPIANEQNTSAQPGPDVFTSGAPPAQPRDYTVQNFFQMKNAVPAAPQTQDENPFAAFLESLKTGASAEQNTNGISNPVVSVQAGNDISNPSNSLANVQTTNGISNSRNLFITSRQPASRSLPTPPPTPDWGSGFRPMLREQEYLLCLPAGARIFLRCGAECCVTNGALGMEWQESLAFWTAREAVGYREAWPCRGCGERLVLDWWEIRRNRLGV